jgi:hypothetical protein
VGTTRAQRRRLAPAARSAVCPAAARPAAGVPTAATLGRPAAPCYYALRHLAAITPA